MTWLLWVGLVACGSDDKGTVEGTSADVEADVDTDVEADIDTDTDADADSDADADADSDTDADTDSDADTDADSDTDTDGGTDVDVDTVGALAANPGGQAADGCGCDTPPRPAGLPWLTRRR